MIEEFLPMLLWIGCIAGIPFALRLANRSAMNLGRLMQQEEDKEAAFRRLQEENAALRAQQAVPPPLPQQPFIVLQPQDTPRPPRQIPYQN